MIKRLIGKIGYRLLRFAHPSALVILNMSWSAYPETNTTILTWLRDRIRGPRPLQPNQPGQLPDLRDMMTPDPEFHRTAPIQPTPAATQPAAHWPGDPPTARTSTLRRTWRVQYANSEDSVKKSSEEPNNYISSTLKKKESLMDWVDSGPYIFSKP